MLAVVSESGGPSGATAAEEFKLAFLTYGFANWGGGLDFIRHLAGALDTAGSDAGLAPTLMVASEDVASRLKRILSPIKGLLLQACDGQPLRWVPPPVIDPQAIRHAVLETSNTWPVVECGSAFASQLRLSKELGCRVAMPCFFPPARVSPIPWVGYVYDFQHVHLPDNFSAAEKLARDAHFSSMMGKARHVLVNARAIAEDAMALYPGSAARLHVIPFSPYPRRDWLTNQEDVRLKYGITRPYFVISNQFWRHKDHATAFRAFRQYLDRGGRAMLVCTGTTTDYRFPHYFDELQDLIRELELSGHVSIVGHIPKLDQIALLRQSLALVQPTLSEGGPGGGATFDAVALGVPVVLSDIKVNLEACVGDVTWFRAGDASHLADALLAIPKERLPAADAELWAAGEDRRRICGNFLVHVAREAAREA